MYTHVSKILFSLMIFVFSSLSANQYEASTTPYYIEVSKNESYQDHFLHIDVVIKRNIINSNPIHIRYDIPSGLVLLSTDMENVIVDSTSKEIKRSFTFEIKSTPDRNFNVYAQTINAQYGVRAKGSYPFIINHPKKRETIEIIHHGKKMGTSILIRPSISQ